MAKAGIARTDLGRPRFHGGGTPATGPRSRSPCEIEGCEKPVLARRWCAMHYRRWERTGDPLGRR